VGPDQGALRVGNTGPHTIADDILIVMVFKVGHRRSLPTTLAPQRQQAEPAADTSLTLRCNANSVDNGGLVLT
jgi:hypothetical protein